MLEKVEYQKVENPKTFDIHNITTTYLDNEIYVTAEDNKKLYQAFMLIISKFLVVLKLVIILSLLLKRRL